MPGKVWSDRELRLLKFLYLEEGCGPKECAETLEGRTEKQTRQKLYDLGWTKLKKVGKEIGKQVSDDAPTVPKVTDGKVALAKQEGRALTQEHLKNLQEKTAGISDKVLVTAETAADMGLEGLEALEQAARIVERLDNVHRKASGIDSNYGGAGTFNVFFARGVKITKVGEEDEDEEDNDDVIDV